MPVNQQHHRRSIRLPGYDYSQAGEYFITICTHQRQRLFGQIVDDDMRLNEIGEIVRKEWEKTAVMRPVIELGTFVVMPNHFHAIVHIVGENDLGSLVGGDLQVARTDKSNQAGDMDESKMVVSLPRGPKSNSIGAIIAGFKSAATFRINVLRSTPGLPVWQRNYYEHIIQTEKEYLAIDAYIESNPANWLADQENR